jgi:hypothetical protein
MKHRGPDSTGYALYRPEAEGYVMHVKLSESNGHDFEFAERLQRQRGQIEDRLRSVGARILTVDASAEHTMTLTFDHDGDLKELADNIEDVRGAEVLSLGRSLEIIKDLGDAETVAAEYGLNDFIGTHAIGHARMATESDVDIANAHPYWAYPFPDVAVVHNQLTNYHQWRDAGARRAPLPVGVRLGIIAVYLAELMARANRSRTRCPQPPRARRRVHLSASPRTLGVAKDELGAKPLVLYESDDIVARLRGDRDPQGRRSRDRDVRSLRGRGDGADNLTATSDARRARRARRHDRISRSTASAPCSTRAAVDAQDQRRAALAALRAGIRTSRSSIKRPSFARHGDPDSLPVTFEGSLGYFGVG